MLNELQPNRLQTALAPDPEAEREAARRVTERLNRITTRAKRGRFLRLASNVMALLSILTIFSVLIPLIKPPNDISLAELAAIGLTGTAGLILSMAFSLKATLQFDVAEIARVGGVQAIVPLFIALRGAPTVPQQQAIANELTTLLPQMQSSDSYLLTPTLRRMMSGWLDDVGKGFVTDGGRDASRVALLKALEQVGDASAIPAVTRLTKMEPRTPGETKIQHAALECLPKLLMNCGEVEAARVLLRASQAEAAHSASLLRPASGAGQTDPAELLREADPPHTVE